MIVFINSLSTSYAANTKQRSSRAKSSRNSPPSLSDASRELGHELVFVTSADNDNAVACLSDRVILLPEVAVPARANLKSETSEIEKVIHVIQQHRSLQRIAEPALLDCSDVIQARDKIYVAQTSRTNAEGIHELKTILTPHGYQVIEVETHSDKRLRDACSFISPCFLLANPAWIEMSAFRDLTVISVDEKEPRAASTLTLAGTTLVSSSFPKTEKRLREAGIPTLAVDVSEIEKLGGSLGRLALLKEPRYQRTSAKTPTPRLKSVSVESVPNHHTHSSHAIVHDSLVHVSMQLPFDVGSAATEMSIGFQMEGVIKNVSAILHSSGSKLSCVIRATIYVRDRKHIAEINSVFAREFGEHKPACSVVTNHALPDGVLVAMDAVAALP